MEKQITIPRLRFPGFEGEWKCKSFGELYTFRSTNSFSRDNLNYVVGEVKNIHYGDIHTKFNSHFNITKEIVPYINSEIQQKKFPVDNYCCEGDLIIADASEDYADIGKSIEIVCLNNEKTVAGLHTLHARPNLENLAIGFGGHVMKSDNIRFQIKTIAQGTKVLSITTGRLSNIIVNFPTIPEQTIITSFLSSVDDNLSNLKKKKSLLEQFKKGVMQKIFSQELRFKDENGEDFVDWGLVRLGDFLLRYGEKSTTNNQFPVLTSSRKGLYFQKDYFDGSDVASKDNTGYNVVPRNYFTYRHMSDDVTFKFNINRICDKGIVSTLYPVFTTTNINNEFLQLKLNEGVEFQKYAIEQKQGGSRTYMYYNKLENLNVCLPSLPEQSKIANFLAAIDDKINQCGKQIEKMELWKKGLLQQMFC